MILDSAGYPRQKTTLKDCVDILVYPRSFLDWTLESEITEHETSI